MKSPTCAKHSKTGQIEIHTRRKRGIRPPPVSTGCFKPDTNANLVPVLQHSAPRAYLGYLVQVLFNTNRY